MVWPCPNRRRSNSSISSSRRRRDVSFLPWRAVAACIVVQISVVIFGVLSFLAKGTHLYNDHHHLHHAQPEGHGLGHPERTIGIRTATPTRTTASTTQSSSFLPDPPVQAILSNPDDGVHGVATQIQHGDILTEFDRINEKLLGPPSYGDGHCPPNCGCVETPHDCPRWYDIESILQSASMPLEQNALNTTTGSQNTNTNDNDDGSNDDDNNLLLAELQKRFQRRKVDAQQECQENIGGVLSKGGWCLSDEGSKETVVFHQTVIPIPQDHVPESKTMLQTLKRMIKEEGIQSINDFGAGVGQYKAGILRNIPNITYRAYDGAGNIEEYTKGFVSFFDLSIPLVLPKSDWVLSWAVGEHVPSRFEGMVIRNLHRHNCKGIILMWGLLGMNGTSHINNHSLEYIIDVFTNLGYTVDEEMTGKFRNPAKNYFWFVEGTIVLRRNQIVC
jgi:hypothetical protein